MMTALYDTRPARQVATALCAPIKNSGAKPPEISTIIKLISRHRSEAKTWESEEDKKEWSLDHSHEAGIPPDANRVLMKLWRRCRIIDRPFTVREAKWAARLSGLVPFTDLLDNAVHFAWNEKQTVATGEPAASDWCDSMRFTGQTPVEKALYKSMRRVNLLPDSTHLDLLITGSGTSNLGEVIQSRLGLDIDHKQPLPAEGDELYALWLRNLGRGPDWKRLESRDQADIAHKLYQGVLELCRASDAVSPGSDEERRLVDWEPPAAILRRVGFKDKTQPEQDESTGL